MNRIRSFLTVSVFALLLGGVLLAQALLPDAAVSASERRKLAQRPVLSVQSVFSGKYMTQLESYLLDQFPAREGFRTLHALFTFRALGQKDVDGVYLVGGQVSKLEYPLREDETVSAAEKFNAIYETYLTGLDAYYAVIPDKNVFLAEENGYPHMDYDRLLSLLRENVRAEIGEVALFDCLTADDYFRTDAHWRQERLDRVLSRLTSALGVPSVPLGEYETHTLAPFYGVYSGQSALPVAPDELTYLTGPATEQSVVTSAEQEGELPVYTTEKFSGMDGYDVFLSGAQAVLTIENPAALTDGSLVVFRDSFASSLAPLLCASYARVTLVDLRYISSALLGDYVDFTDADVLFLYSTTLINSSHLLK